LVANPAADAPQLRPADVGRLADELSELALAGQGWAQLLEHLAAGARREARLIGVHGGVVAASPDGGDTRDRGVEPSTVAALAEAEQPMSVTCADGWTGAAVPLRAGPRRAGLLLLQEPLTAGQRALLLAARVPVCIEAVRRDIEATARAESASRLIDEVRYGPLRHPDEVLRAAERFDLALDRPHAAAVFAYDGANKRTWATALSWIETPVRQDDALGWTVLVDDADVELGRIRTRLQGMVGDDARVLAATGSVVSDVTETARSFFEAEVTLSFLRRRPRTAELRFSSLGLSGLLLSVPQDRLRDFVASQLGPIAHREDLLTTLAAWMETNGSRAAVAHRLDIHRNSVGYRMSKIRELLDYDPLDAQAGVQLQSALLAREILAVLDEHGDRRRGEPVNPRPPRYEGALGT
jgi:hypothetical protein